MKGILWAVVIDPTVLAEVTSRYPVEQRHHITLQYGVEEAAWTEWIGQEFMAVAVEECWDAQIQALRIELPPHIPCNNLHPHITLSHQQDIEPKGANEMLASFHQSQLLWLAVPVRIEFMPKSTLFSRNCSGGWGISRQQGRSRLTLTSSTARFHQVI